MKIQIRASLIVLLVAALLAGAATTGAAAAQRGQIRATEARSKIAPDLDESVNEAVRRGPINVIVTYRSAPDAGDLRKARLAGRVSRPLRSVDGLAARMTRRGIERLARDPHVVSISPDRPVHSTMDVAYPATGAAAAFQRFGVTGRHVTVAIVDSGIAATPGIAPGRVLAAVDFVDTAAPALRDPFGHGTHIASIIGSGDSTYRGMATGVTADAVERLIGDPALRRRLIEAGYATARQHTLERQAEFIVDRLRTYVGRPLAAAPRVA